MASGEKGYSLRPARCASSQSKEAVWIEQVAHAGDIQLRRRSSNNIVVDHQRIGCGVAR
jgi:hypothetical protein